MRCPSCGTENAPDSRFCGGCGARFTTGNTKVAPTQKISDDAPFPPTGSAPAAAPGSAYVAQSVAQVAPPAMPPSAPRTLPPNNGAPVSYAGPAPRAPATMTEPSLSMPMVARRPWGLIAVVLVIDIALAAAGAWMLSQGLSNL